MGTGCLFKRINLSHDLPRSFFGYIITLLHQQLLGTILEQNRNIFFSVCC